MFDKNELRNELIAAVMVVIGFPIILLGLFAIIPHV